MTQFNLSIFILAEIKTVLFLIRTMKCESIDSAARMRRKLCGLMKDAHFCRMTYNAGDTILHQFHMQ